MFLNKVFCLLVDYEHRSHQSTLNWNCHSGKLAALQDVARATSLAPRATRHVATLTGKPFVYTSCNVIVVCCIGWVLKSKNYLKFLKSYLEDRIFYVKLNDAYSCFYDIKAGVPQGSILGPSLYLLYTADVPESESVMTATFADDTAVLTSNEDRVEASKTLQTHLDKVHTWMNEWRIKASALKSSHITFTLRKQDCPAVNLGGELLPHCNVVKYLGFHLDRKQTWKTHIQQKRDQLNYKYKSLEWLLGRKSRLSVENKTLIYKCVLKPVWTYGIELWGTAKTSNTEILQRFQNSVLKAIVNAPWFSRMEDIHEYLGLNTVKEEINMKTKIYKDRITHHQNKLAQMLSDPPKTRRLKRLHTWDNL
ncbi:unnamed protein product [Plutella xylostella]|uniref:(diamondback moth) hypothetical protein n=1 Tax=Plutella xylostella TaxID=51655 RepID=A0A8S4DD52_PLUXY|nr:unnamed protein product [Plutella xylostella]